MNSLLNYDDSTPYVSAIGPSIAPYFFLSIYGLEYLTFLQEEIRLQKSSTFV